jgi:sarcosine oxidase gamma subunit
VRDEAEQKGGSEAGGLGARRCRDAEGVNGLEFLIADPQHEAWRSPLARALAHAPAAVRDVSAEAQDGPLGPAAGVAGIEIEAPFAQTLLARLTDLEPPGIGALAHVRAQITHEDADRYRIWFPQEYADYLAHVVIDAYEGLV